MALDFVILTNHRPHRRHLTPPTTSQLLLSAIKHDHFDAVIDLIDAGVDLSVKGDNCWTPLTLACHLGRLNVVSYLLYRNDEACGKRHTYCGINHCNDHGDTPLISAARWGHTAVVKLLVESGADPNLSNQYNSVTPLLVAIEGGHVDVVAQLLEFDADVQLTDNVKMTPLYSAIKLKDPEMRENITSQLIHAGCDVNIGSQDHAPIFLAARLGYLSIVKMLCEADCDIDVGNKYGVTPLYEAAIKGHNDVVSCLLTQGCVVNTQDMYGVSPLHAASLFNNPTAVKLILQYGGSVKLRDQTGRCAVHAAMERGYAEVVQVFLCHGVDITQPPTSLKRMPTLNKIFEDGHIEVVRVLISGCSSLPFTQCSSAPQVFRSNPELLEMLTLSGMQGLPKDFAKSCQQFEHSQADRMSPLTLQNICRIHVRQSLGNKILFSYMKLPLPNKLKDFIIFR